MFAIIENIKSQVPLFPPLIIAKVKKNMFHWPFD